MTVGDATDEIDLIDPSLYADGFPHDLFAELRARGPVLRHRETVVRQPLNDVEQTMGFWCVLGHPELQAVNRNWQGFSSWHGPTIPRGTRGTAGMLGLDPPEHHRLRQLVSAGFTPRMIARLEERITWWTDRLLDEVAGGECDFVESVAFALPMHVIADIIGIPEADRPWVFERTEHVLHGLDPTRDPAQPLQSSAELYAYATELGAEKRARPQDDVWSKIIAAHLPADETDAEVDDDSVRLSSVEVDTFFLVLSIAGSETTRTALSTGLQALVAHPDQLAALRHDPGVLETMPDEILRFTSPVLAFGRDCEETVEVGGQVIEAGDRVVMFHPSANRDQRVFTDPDHLDLRRDPNPHVAFGGGGPHYCLGANLAKKEIRVVFERIVDRFDTIEVTGDVTWTGPGPISNVGTHIDQLPVRLA